MKLLDILKAPLWPLKALDQAASAVVAEKTDVAMSTVFAELDEHSPVAAALLRGEPVELTITLQAKVK